MKLALFLMATLASTSTLARQCDIDSAQLKADYKITNTHNHEQSTQSLTLWRNNSQVAHQREVITELWQHLANKQIRPIRYFNAQQRGIEYQPSEVRGIQNWSAKNQLVDAHLIEKMTLLNTQGTGCDEVKNYALTQGDNQFKLALLTKSNLVKSFSVTNKKNHTHTALNLNNVSSNKAEITAQFAKWDRFQTTDYADIGDNENDPFLAKMINLGFIEHSATGFYNQQGKAIQGGHHH
ncbi:hypothetical protein AN391_02303 [Pseudoalteromonas sp. P1-13-1a]|uniref:hypothetical protein n=1 Tax=Pseudoalteromonas sp. P1-13-1a TaxID=1723756 RepID=UPI0006D65498|nr:hypothetical protein [Pseudoalteromonas sp. P1-13-1a]KPZ56154.1 hypothetical protein AN391_02303 [Pseudoalteromonas sp. P1-13-1a]